MQKAISGYWKLYKEYGLTKAIRFMYSWYYGQHKQRGIDLTKQQIVIVNGYKLLTIPNDKGISVELIRFGTHEPLTTKIILKELREGMTCLDVGGNIGYYVMLENKIVGKKGKVIAIEPSPVNFEYLKKNIELQDSSNIEAYNLACGSINDKVDFLIRNPSNACKVFKKGDEIAPDEKVITIPMVKLDTFVEDKSIEKIDFLRMDIEGYEYEAIKGASKIIHKSKPMLQMEIHPGYMGSTKSKELLEFLENEDYDVQQYVLGRFETPFVGSDKDIKKYSINQLLNMLDNNALPRIFLAFFKQKDEII